MDEEEVIVLSDSDEEEEEAVASGPNTSRYAHCGTGNNERRDEQRNPKTSSESDSDDSVSSILDQGDDSPKEQCEEAPENQNCWKKHGRESFSQPVESLALYYNENRDSENKPQIDIDKRPISLVRFTSDGAFTEKKRRKRTREEIEAEQMWLNWLIAEDCQMQDR
ncbi:unnamed protein product [Gongylonema pulchrum]|uniref:Protein CASC3 n=1 Tax=Gongylonema pulchrum TaxID=637853 RepID=A0A183EUJ9_9BILA|nr:unnamed protein product [Gongylonema pulchrum]